MLQLLLLLVLQPLGSDSEEYIFFQTVRDGDNATLLCQKEFDGQEKCELTDWIHTSDRGQTKLISRGDKLDEVGASVTLLPNCSLFLHSVSVEQAGEYRCAQYNDQGGQRTLNNLSIASLSEAEDGGTLRCSVATSGTCRHEVKWFDDDEEVTEAHGELQTSRSSCGASVSLKDESPLFRFYRTLKCEVRQTDPNQTLVLFPPPPPDVSTTAATTTAPEGLSNAAALSLKVVVPVVVAVLLIAAVAVALILWRRLKESGDTDENAVEPEDGVTYTSVIFNRKGKKEANKVEIRAEDEDVTYSSVKVAAAAQSERTAAPGNKEL